MAALPECIALSTLTCPGSAMTMKSKPASRSSPPKPCQKGGSFTWLRDESTHASDEEGRRGSHVLYRQLSQHRTCRLTELSLTTSRSAPRLTPECITTLAPELASGVPACTGQSQRLCSPGANAGDVVKGGHITSAAGGSDGPQTDPT